METHLTIEEADSLADNFSSDSTKAHYRQLADTMRENERMASALREIYLVQRLPENAFTECVNIAARGLGEQQHKDSENVG